MVHQPFTKSAPRVKREVQRLRVKTESFVTDGLLSTYVTNEQFDKFGDENNHYRDFSLQTLIRAQAVELLKPVGALPYQSLKAADVLGEVTASFDNLHTEFSNFVAAHKSVEQPESDNE